MTANENMIELELISIGIMDTNLESMVWVAAVKNAMKLIEGIKLLVNLKQELSETLYKNQAKISK